MDLRIAGQALAVNRILFGAGMLALPERSAAGWIGRPGRDSRVTILTRAVGARDVAVGAGTLAARDDPRALLTWMVAQVISDGADLASTFTVRDKLPRTARAFGLAVTGGSTLAGLAGAIGAAKALRAAGGGRADTGTSASDGRPGGVAAPIGVKTAPVEPRR